MNIGGEDLKRMGTGEGELKMRGGRRGEYDII
jgi:hypothetical protein